MVTQADRLIDDKNRLIMVFTNLILTLLLALTGWLTTEVIQLNKSISAFSERLKYVEVIDSKVRSLDERLYRIESDVNILNRIHSAEKIK